MKRTYSGRCQCGRIRYLLDGEITRLNVCHCRDCQMQSGRAFGMRLEVPEEMFHLTAGELKTFETVAESGRRKTCAFCGHCGVRIYNATSVLKGIKLGTLDDTTWLRPDAHYWTKSKQPWTVLSDDSWVVP